MTAVTEMTADLAFLGGEFIFPVATEPHADISIYVRTER